MDTQQNTQSLANIVGKLKLFKGLAPSESAPILKICGFKSYTPKEVVFQAGDPSNEMLVLLQGKLIVVGESGTLLGEIMPGTSCGEMGVFTGRVRSATVIAETKASGFVINGQQLDTVMRAYPEAHVKILKNIIAVLSDRLSGADVQIESFAGKLRRAEDENGMMGEADSEDARQ